MYNKLLETDPLELRNNRLRQIEGARAIIRHYDGWSTPRSSQSSLRRGDLREGMRLVNHFPTTRTPYEGDPEKAAEESRKDEKERDGVQRADGLKSVRGRSILS
ncbi:hypothetical protein K466DRAFT_603945 [Polyporus arcularius HHB13444]|uniref:Uncharacterized protein n=1 Tax=Polyporus arcularius HHB13444 TaxID=1314778 RepID=A0A5C3NYD6_9APHY|nr:hypothetical protein K466DRAFT_603945 [Polyporus arcularius HHB13444]